MKKTLILLLVLLLAFCLTACGEDEQKPTDPTTVPNNTSAGTTVSTTAEPEPLGTDATTTITDTPATDPTGSRTIVTKPSVTMSATTTKAPTTTATTKAPTTTTKAPTTTTVAVEQPVDPSGLVLNVEYWGNDYRVEGADLTFTALTFDGEYCVITDRMFTSEPEIAEGTTIQYGGKTYYSVGGGFHPALYTLSDTAIAVRDMNTGMSIGTLALYRDGTVRVLEVSTSSLLGRNITFTLQPQ